MNLDDFLRLNPPTPDDIEDIREFFRSVEEKVPPHNLESLIDQFLSLSVRMGCILQDVHKLQKEAEHNLETGLAISVVVQLYKFLKKNEQKIKQLMSVNNKGEPFFFDL